MNHRRVLAVLATVALLLVGGLLWTRSTADQRSTAVRAAGSAPHAGRASERSVSNAQATAGRRSEAIGAAPTRGEAAPAPEGIGGTVFGGDGKPFASARVELWRDADSGAWIHAAADLTDDASPRAATASDAAGDFFLTAGTGTWRLVVHGDGHAVHHRSGLRAGDRCEVRLERASAVVVRVVDAAGGPIARAHVALHPDFASPEGTAVAAMETDARGEARLAPVGSAEFYLVVRHPEYTRAHTRVAALETGVPGRERRVEVSLSAGFALLGTVSPAPGAGPLRDARVRVEAFSLGRSEILEIEPDEQGRFATDRRFAARETVSVFASARGLAEVPRTVRMPDGEDALRAAVLEIQLGERGRVVAGRAVDEFHAPLGNVDVRTTHIPLIPRGHAGLAQALARVSPHPERWRLAARTLADGFFEIEGLGVGRQLVLVLVAEGRAPLFLWPDPLGDEERVELGDVVLEQQAGLFGSLRDASGKPRAGIELRAQREIVVAGSALDDYRPERWWRAHRAVSDDEGRFAIRGLAGGTYELVAQGVDLAPVAVAAGHESGPFDFEIEVSEPPAATARVVGNARDPRDQPVAGLFAALRPVGASEDTRPLAMTFTDVLGRFDLTAPRGEALVLSISDPKGLFLPAEHALVALEDSVEVGGMAVRADPQVREPLTVLVRSPDGQPLADVDVVLEPPQNRWCGCLAYPSRSDADGYAYFERIGAGEHVVRVRDPRQRYAEAVRVGVRAGDFAEVVLQY
ncbi:MAG: hypothetical protein GC161_09000 [Planctomycetaceae bacterium]|nr:hypothetical protein [Planctomycetaceae bacterium]